MATYTKRGEGQWQAKIRKTGYPTQTQTFRNKALAQRWAIQIEAQMDNKIFISSLRAESTTFQQLADRYIAEILPSKKSADKIESTIRNICSYLGDYSAIALTPEVLVGYRDTRLKTVKNDTVRKDLLRIRRILVIAAKEWGIYLPHGNPIDMITIPAQATRGRDRRLEGDEEERLRLAAKQYGGEILSVMVFATETGMRRGEIVDLRWENINRIKKIAKLLDTKNGEDRTIPLSPKALKIIESLPINISGKVFSMRGDSISQAFERCCKRANIVNLRFHDLRHEATSRFFEMGFNLMEVSSITGHKDLAMLKRYTHLRAEDLVKRLINLQS
jgi:integrase